jgi:hypothetical protein
VMGIVEQTTGKALNGLLLMAGALLVAAACSVRLRHGSERKPLEAEQGPLNPAADAASGLSPTTDR